MIEERNKEKVGSLYRDVWDQFKKHKGALFGGVVFIFIVISVIAVSYTHLTLPTKRIV